jgi:SAM-dependent methyltransferase
VDLSPALIAALRERAGGLSVEAVVGDARAMTLARTDHALCLVPMQTIQLLDEQGRARLLSSARTHMRPGAVMCFALVTAPEPFNELAGDEIPPPDTGRVDGVLHMSRPVRVAVSPERIGIERERVIVAPDGGEDTTERDLVVLCRLSARALREEGRAAGLHPAGTVAIASTEEHVGGTVVMLRA